MARAALDASGLRLRPSRGQHVLVSRRVLERIIAAAEPGPDDLILEVGAGIGTLTVALARTGAAVCAIEVDARFIPVLRAVCTSYPRVQIVHADAMALDPCALPPATKVVANLPYSIASPLVISLLEVGVGRRFVVMVQDEVARRMVARTGSAAYGLLSLAVQAHAVPSIVARVPRTAFFPPPQVASSIIRLDVPDHPPVPRELAPWLMRVVRAAFGQRRKMLRAALQTALAAAAPSAAAAEALCGTAGIDPRRRGESLSLEEFVRLAQGLRDRETCGLSGSPQVG